MNSRTLLNFLKSTSGKFVIFLVILGIGLAFVSQQKKESAPTKKGKSGEVTTASPLASTTIADAGQPSSEGFVVSKQMKQARTLVPASPTPTPQPAPVSPRQAGAEQAEGQTTTESTEVNTGRIRIFAETPRQAETPEILPTDAYAPFGRMLQCELTTTVDSSSLETPIVGLVTHDLWWKNASGEKKLIIPANSEVHGVARQDRVRERIASNGSWVVVLAEGTDYPAGTELLLNGLALDMQMIDGKFDITDGSAGLKGKVLTNTSSMEEVKLFAATFLSGASKGMVKTQTGWAGNQEVVGGLQTAGAMAASSVIDQYAKMIMDSIQRDGWFVRVPAGKQFYLYVRQDILLRKAKLGASLALPLPRDKPENVSALSLKGQKDADRIIEAQQRQLALREAMRARTQDDNQANYEEPSK